MSRRGRLLQTVDLVLYKALADLRAERERTYLGFLWWFLEPILFMAVLAVIRVGVLGRGSDDMIPMLLTGLVFWQWFQATLIQASNAILQSQGIMRTVKVHPAVFPLALTGANSFKFLLVLCVLVAYLALSGYRPGLGYLWLPLLLVGQLMLIIAGGTLLAALVPFVPDLRFVAEPVLRAMFFLTPIFYTLEDLPEQYRHWMLLNPMAAFVEAARDVLVQGVAPVGQAWMLWSLASALAALAALALVRALAPRYSKLPG